jgi:hypothetical protein
MSISLGSTITKSCLLELCKFIELLKAIRRTYQEKMEIVTLLKQYILQANNRKLLSFILAAKVSAANRYFLD